MSPHHQRYNNVMFVVVGCSQLHVPGGGEATDLICPAVFYNQYFKVNVAQDDLNSFLAVAEELKVGNKYFRKSRTSY